MAVESPATINDTTRDVTLSIEREGGWRGLAPGENPKLWSLQIRGLKPFVSDPPDTSSNTRLLDGDSHLATGTIQNRSELAAGSLALSTKNFIDIPAASIPGDMPALITIGATVTGSADETAIFVSRSTKETSVLNRDISPVTYISRHTINVSDGSSVIADTTIVADTGAPRPIGGASGQRSRTTFATSAALVQRLSLGTPHPLLFRGRYAVFLRARLSAGSTTVQVQLVINNITYDAKTITDQGAGGTGNTTEWGIVYMGVVSLPQDEAPTIVSSYGMGVSNRQDTASYGLSINASRTAGAGELYMSDLIFMPIDECAALLRFTNANFNLGNGDGVIDNTGYFLRGKPAVYGGYHGSGIVTGSYAELLGQEINLIPGINNRLIFWSYIYATNRSIINRNLNIFVNIARAE